MQVGLVKMEHDTHSSHRAEDEENNNGRLRHISEKRPIDSHSDVSATTGLRRSARETSSKKMIPSPSSMQKSEQVEKRTPPTLAVRRKSERVEKQKMPSPLRRSGRTKKLSSSNPSGSRSSGSSGSKQMPKREKSVKQLTFEAKEISENEEHDVGTSQVKIKRMDARMYRAIFKKINEDCHEEPNSMEKSTQEGGDNGGGKIDECFKGSHLDCKEVSKDGILPSEDAKAKEMRVDSSLSGPMKELLEKSVSLGSLVPSNATTCEPSGAPEMVQSDCCGEETLQMLLSRNSKLNANLFGNSVGHESGEKLISSKRKGTMVDKHSDVSATLVNDDNCNLIADAGTSRLCGNTVGTGGSCSKRIRLDHDPTVSCCNEPCNPSVNELRDRGDTEVSMLQKECPANIQTDVAKNICLICKSEGKLLFCDGKGCNGRYHLSCLEPPLVDAPLGVWYCHVCGRKIELGVYSVSKGVESVWNAKEVPFSNVDGRPRGNDVESEKIRKLRDEQRSLHLLLKPEIAKLCEILLLPDNVKSMVNNFLEYVMNNHHVNREPVSILQAFQISLCWTAASLLNYKLDHKASLVLAKQHLNFDCKKEEADYIYSLLRCLKKIFLYRTGNSNVTGSPKASQSSNRVYSYTGVAPEAQLANKDISKSIKEIQKKCQGRLGNLLLMHQEKKQELKAAVEDEKADFERRYKIRSAVIQSCSPNDVMTTEKLKVFNSEYDKGIEKLKWQREIDLKELEDEQLEKRQECEVTVAAWVEEVKSWAGDEYLQTCDQAQPYNGPKHVALVSDHVAEGKSFDNIVEAMTRTGTGVGLSKAPDTNSHVIVLCSSPVELQTPLVENAGTNEMDIMASEDRPVSRNEGRNIAENEYDNQENIISKHSHSREQNSDGATSMADEGEGCENFSRDGCGEDTVTLVLPSSDGEICDGETTDVPSGEMALDKTSISNDGQDEVPSSRQGKLDGTILSKPVCGFSLGEVEANDFSDGVKNMASLNSQSPEEHIPSVIDMSMPNCENDAQIHEADDSNGLNNADTLNASLSDETIASLNSKSPEEHVHSVIATCMPNCENSAQIHEADDRNGSTNAVSMNSPLPDKRIADGAIVSVLDREVHLGMPRTVNFTHCTENVTGMNPPSSMEQIYRGAVNVSVLDRELSRPCGTATPSNGPDAITLLNQPCLEKQNPDGVSSSICAGQIPVDLSETSHEGATVSVIDREVPVGMPGTVNFTDYSENVTPLNSSSMDQISDGGSVNVLDRVLSSRSCGASSPSDGPATISLLNPPSLEQQIPDRVSISIPDGQILVVVPQISHEVAECHNDRDHLTESLLVDKSTTSALQEGVHRTMTKNTLSQETPVSRPVDLMEPEQVELLSSVESPPDQDTAREMQNTSQQVELVSSPVDIVPANQSNHVSLIVEPPEQVQQLPSAEFLSSSQDPSNLPLVAGIEHQPTNEDALSSHVPEAVQVPNQAVMHPASILELDSRSHQVAVHPASNLDLDSLMPGGVRTQSSNTRNLSTPSEINNHPIQTATQSASRTVSPLCSDPLKHELERIHKLAEQNMKNHEDLKLQLKSDFEKELEELHRKYDIKFQETGIEFQQTKKNLDTSFNTVLVNKVLAETFRSKCMDLKVSGASGMQQDPNATWSSLVAGSSSCGPPAVSLQSSSTMASSQTMVGPSSCEPPAVSLQSSSTMARSQTMVPPIQAAYNTSGIFSTVSARLPNINSISSPSGNLQAGGEIRAPAPHLQPYRPSASVPASSFPTVPHGIPSQPAPSNIPATSPSFSLRLPQLTPTTYQSDPHRRHWPESAGGLPPPNLSSMDFRMDANSQSGINLPNVLSRMSDVASLNLARFGTSSSMLANSANQATCPDVVCLSDDD